MPLFLLADALGKLANAVGNIADVLVYIADAVGKRIREQKKRNGQASRLPESIRNTALPHTCPATPSPARAN